MLEETVSQCCMNCERLARELAAANKRLADAEGWLRQFNTCLSLQDMTKLLRAVHRFLNIEVAEITGEDVVVVRRDDLNWLWFRAHNAILDDWEGKVHCDQYNRLEAAMEKKP